MRTGLIKLAVLIENSRINVDILYGLIDELSPQLTKPSTGKAKIKLIIKFMREHPALLLRCFSYDKPAKTT